MDDRKAATKWLPTSWRSSPVHISRHESGAHFALSGMKRFGKVRYLAFGVGLFFHKDPWIMINNGYQCPFKLTLIDGGYATFGCRHRGYLTLFF
jgi:hypothetical protein